MKRPPSCTGCPFYDGGRADAFVPFVGPLNAQIVAIAESPGRDEVGKEEPLVGPSGFAFNTACRFAGIERSRTLIGNTILCRPPKPYDQKDPDWMAAISHCALKHTRPILDNTQPNAVILIGAAALLAHTGFRPVVTKIAGRTKTLNGIENVRGSAYRASELMPTMSPPLPKWGGRDPWIVPTIHPAFVLRGNQHLKPLLSMDFAKAIRLARGLSSESERSAKPDGPVPAKFDLHAEPTDVVYALKDLDAFGYDIETNESGAVTMIGLGAADGRVWVTRLAQGIRDLLSMSTADKTGHNIAFDIKGIASGVREPWFDTIVAAGLVQPALPKSLHETASIYGPDSYFYWKDLDKNDRTQFVAKKRYGLPDTFTDWDRFYNALDVWWTMRVRSALLEEMRELGLIELFRYTQMALMPELLKIERIGMPVDTGMAKKLRGEAREEIKRLEGVVDAKIKERLTSRVVEAQYTHDKLIEAQDAATMYPACQEHPEYAGKTKRSKCPTCFAIWKAVNPIYKSFAKDITNARNSISRAQEFKSGSADDWRWLLFAPKDKGGFGLKTKMKTKVGQKSSVGKDAIRGMLALANLDEDLRAILLARLHIAQLGSRLGKFLSPSVEGDGRMHPAYTLFKALNGRLTSGLDETDSDKPNSKHKINAQNYPEDCRRIVVARPGTEFISYDYSQIEAWTTAMGVWKVTGSRAYWDMLSTPGLDIHQMTADLMTRKMREMGGEERPIIRYQGKRIRHLWTYNGTAKVMAKILAGDGVTYEIAKAGEKALIELHPDVVEYKNARIRIVSRALIDRNPFGRICVFTVGKRGNELVVDDPNVPISWWPASTAHDIAKRAWLRLAERLKRWPGCNIINHMHDSFLFEIPEMDPAKRDEFINMVKMTMEEGVFVLSQWHPDGVPFVPRVEIEAGRNWGPWHEHDSKCKEDCRKPVNLDGLRKINARQEEVRPA